MSRSPRLHSPVRREIAFGIRKDHVSYRLVVLDVAGAAAKVTVERIGDGLLEFGAVDRRFGQTFQQDLALVQEAGRAIATLECKVRDKGLLERGKLAILRMTLDGTDRLAVETPEVTQVGLV
jgi:hypothetical protein